MNVRNLFIFTFLFTCVFFVSCSDDEDVDRNRIDPFSLAEGSITFELEGKIFETTGGSADMDGENTLTIGETLLDTTSGEFNITRTVFLAFGDPDGINTEMTYDIPSSLECAQDNTLPCGGLLLLVPELDIGVTTRYENSSLKIRFEEIGSMKGEKVIGTFEAIVAESEDSDERFALTQGAFNVIIN